MAGDFGTNTSIMGNWSGMENDASFLFARLSTSTQGLAKLDAQESELINLRCLARIERAVQSCGGRITKAQGSGVSAFFDTPDEALKAAFLVQQRVAAIPPSGGVEQVLCIGFSHGPVNKDEEENATGKVAEQAAALAWMAKPGQIEACIRAQAELSPEMAFQYEAHNEQLLTQTKVRSEVVRNCLMLKHAGEILLVDKPDVVINFGRDAQNEVVLQNTHASRHHAKIKQRDNGIVFIDKSTNGSFIRFGDEKPFLLRHAECFLRGKGVITFASQAVLAGNDFTEFELLS